MKRFALAIALACALSGSAFAGDGHTVGAPDPPPPGDIHGTDSPAPGDGHNVDSPGEMPISGLLLTLIDLAF